MKDRILAYLDDFSNGKESDLALELRSELNLDAITFQQYAQEAQAAILHQYSQFAISTIDAFFQKVIRSFTREAGLVGDYRLEVEQDDVLEEVIDNLIDELGSDKELTDWVVDFARENLENERAWDVRQSLIAFAGEIFREEFKAIEDELVGHTQGPDFFRNLLQELRKHRYEFVNTIKGMAGDAMQQFQSNGLQVSDFKYGTNGSIYTFFQKFARIASVKDFNEDGKGKRAEKDFQESKNWPNKETSHAGTIVRLAEDKLLPLLNEMLAYRNSHFETALSAEVALNNFYAFGLLADISRKLKEYKDENNLMLLADAPKFLNGVIRDSDTPFIYEKVGSFFNNYLIDEFQDTSGLQWKNFLPLLTNSLDQGYPSLIVGDVKQAIYRWRGGDLRLLQQDVEQSIGKGRIAVHELNSNYRSLAAVVDFNNALFRSAASEVAAETGQSLPEEAYADVAQKISKTHEGFVRLSFLMDEPEGGLTWKEQAMEQIPRYLEQLQDIGIPLKDIALLVRRNDEGQQIIANLIKYRNSDQAKPGYLYDVVSNESLRLDGAASVNLLLSALKYLLNPDNDIARAQLAYEHSRMHDPGRTLTDVFAVTNQAIFESALPVTFTREKAALKKLPLFELTETIIRIFNLGVLQGELAYLQAFQDLVLDFGSRERNDLGAFIEWWEDNKHKKSIQASGDVAAAQIMTIHKSKGLQFRYVILPFCAWNLDHDPTRSPNLWVRSDEDPFDMAGYLPVKYSSTLQETRFGSFYKEERTRSYLDNLNLLYVGLTRAEQGMIIMAPHPTETRGNKRTVAQTMYSAIQRSEELRGKWDTTRQEWSRGEWIAGPAVNKSGENKEAVGLTVYQASPWRDKLVIRKSGGAYFSADSDNIDSGRYAMYLYTALSRVHYADEVNDILDRMVMEGLFTREEREVVQEELETLLSNPQIAAWFAPGWEVRQDIPVLLPGTAVERRVDRLLLKERHAILIDFKTDNPGKGDTRSILDYVETLHKMNYTEVEGYLVYLKTGEVVGVSATRSRVVKKKDDSQLALEI